MDLPKSYSVPPPPGSDFPSPPNPPPPASQPPPPNMPSTAIPSSTPVSPLDTFPFPPPTIPPSLLKPAKSEGQGAKSKLPFIILVFLLFVLLLSGAAYAIAYEKIKIGNPQIEKKVSDFVQGLPFVPKTPKYLLTQAAQTHQKISRHRFDLSLAVESDSFISSLGINKADIQITGAVDYSDLNNPKLAVNASLTKDFNIDIKKPDKMIYFKINKVPPLLLTPLGFKQGPELNSVLDNWFSYDASTLDTEARRNLDSSKKETSLTNQFAENAIDKLLTEKLLDSIKVTQEKIDTFDTYRLNLPLNKELLDTIDQKSAYTAQLKLSDYITDMVLDLWIDKKDYYVRKISTSFKVKYGNSATTNLLPIVGNIQSTSMSFSGVLKLSNFQEPVSIDRPAKSITYEEFLEMLMGQSPVFQTTKDALPKGRDSARKADAAELLNSIEKFYASYLCYPWSWTGNDCSSNPVQLNKGNLASAAFGKDNNLQALIETNELKPQFRERISSSDSPSSNKLFLIEYQWTPTTAGQVFVCFEPESEDGRSGELGRLSSASGGAGKCDDSLYSGETKPDANCLICIPQ